MSTTELIKRLKQSVDDYPAWAGSKAWKSGLRAICKSCWVMTNVKSFRMSLPKRKLLVSNPGLIPLIILPAWIK